MALRRIHKEFDDMLKLCEEGVMASPVGDDMFTWTVQVIGPAGTPYEEKLLSLQLRFPSDYPFKPFKLEVVDDQPQEFRILCHPSLSAGSLSRSSGRFRSYNLAYVGCTGDQWSPAFNVPKIIREFILPQLRACSSQEAFLDYFKNERYNLYTKRETEPVRHYDPPPEPLFERGRSDIHPITVKTLTGRTIEVGPFASNATAYHLKHAVEQSEGTPIDMQRIVYIGKAVVGVWPALDVAQPSSASHTTLEVHLLSPPEWQRLDVTFGRERLGGVLEACSRGARGNAQVHVAAGNSVATGASEPQT